MIGQNVNLRPFATRLEAIAVKQEEIAKTIQARSQEQFDSSFTLEIVRRKLEMSKLVFQEQSYSDFPFLIKSGNGFLVGVTPRKLLEDERKNQMNMYCNKIKSRFDDFKNSSGIIMFLPYLMNGNTLRDELYRQLPIGFVNLCYDNNSLERRFRQYSLK